MNEATRRAVRSAYIAAAEALSAEAKARTLRRYADLLLDQAMQAADEAMAEPDNDGGQP